MKTIYIVGIIFIFSAACSNQENSHEKDIAELIRLHDQQRESHVSKNPSMLVDQFADNIIQVNRGQIDSVASRKEDIERFQKYFNAVEFKKWDDITPPKIRFSDDHSMAYLIIDKLVVTEDRDSIGNKIENTTHFAWISIYKKQKNGDWKIEGVASTNEPTITKPL